MNCHIHNQKQEVTKCKQCGSPICSECADVQGNYNACPKCSKEHLLELQSRYKKGLFANILSVLCVVAFIAVLIVEIITKQAEPALAIAGPIVGGILGVISIALLIRTVLKISKLNKLLSNIK